ncbi:MAG: zinc ABC transporter substrate-binding protein [Planctomycetes bacterium]|nr:zinc ABC transporter substrate-binding protein [Planctomycetota bacterium]
MIDRLHRMSVAALAIGSMVTMALPAQEPAARTAHAVVAATTDVAALCRAIGGDRVAVTTFLPGPQDPHYLDPRPSMLYAVQKAELLVFTGRELESGWLPVLIQNGRNPATQPGQLGNLDCSRAVRALGVPTASIDRSAGDVHMAGNPHYLLDPLCGLQVAELLCFRMAALWPAEKDLFVANFATFRQKLAEAMVGAELAKAYEYEADKLALAYGNGTLLDVLKEQGDLGRLAGWFGLVAPLRGRPVVVDHDLWPYFAERFGFTVFGFLEPKPGVTPSTAHLEQLGTRMRDGRVQVLLASPYFPVQYAEVLQKLLPVQVAAMAHQPGARPGTDDYLAFVDHNVRAVVDALLAADKAPQPR